MKSFYDQHNIDTIVKELTGGHFVEFEFEDKRGTCLKIKLNNKTQSILLEDVFFND